MKIKTHKNFALFAPLREKKTNKLSPGRKTRKGVCGKNKINIEALSAPPAPLREKAFSSGIRAIPIGPAGRTG